ncbi:hypothetical protein B0H14DRAFT_3141953 [Mycena olivaceomarginata]|nr:hypothetical protein B0H14DRAFT_3141953 [Mycena olivaceomarginata]
MIMAGLLRETSSQLLKDLLQKLQKISMLATHFSSPTLMALPDYSEAQFNANLPPLPLGRGLREPQLTPGRQLHDQQLEKSAEAARKRSSTIAYNKSNGTTGSRAAPGSQTRLSESDKAALLNSLSAGSTPSGADQWGSMQNLSRFENGDQGIHTFQSAFRYLLAEGHRDFHDDSIGLEMDGSGNPGLHEIPGMEGANDERLYGHSIKNHAMENIEDGPDSLPPQPAKHAARPVPTLSSMPQMGITLPASPRRLQGRREEPRTVAPKEVQDQATTGVQSNFITP